MSTRSHTLVLLCVLGKMDLIVTNNADDATGAAYVYEVPADFKSPGAVFTRHTLIDGIRIPFPAPGLGAPGTVISFRPAPLADLKPLVLVCGDDNGELYQLTAASQDANSWEYEVGVCVRVYVCRVVPHDFSQPTPLSTLSSIPNRAR